MTQLKSQQQQEAEATTSYERKAIAPRIPEPDIAIQQPAMEQPRA